MSVQNRENPTIAHLHFLQIAKKLERIKRAKGAQKAKEELVAHEYTEKRLKELLPKAEAMERSLRTMIPENKRKIEDLEEKIKTLASDIEKVRSQGRNTYFSLEN